MRVTIRQGVFETNSSSTHSLTMCAKDQYNKWKRGEVYFNVYMDKLPQFCTEDQALWHLRSEGHEYDKEDFDSIAEYLATFDIYSFEGFMNYIDDRVLDRFEEEYISTSGDKIVAFGYYGHD